MPINFNLSDIISNEKYQLILEKPKNFLTGKRLEEFNRIKSSNFFYTSEDMFLVREISNIVTGYLDYGENSIYCMEFKNFNRRLYQSAKVVILPAVDLESQSSIDPDNNTAIVSNGGHLSALLRYERCKRLNKGLHNPILIVPIKVDTGANSRWTVLALRTDNTNQDNIEYRWIDPSLTYGSKAGDPNALRIHNAANNTGLIDNIYTGVITDCTVTPANQENSRITNNYISAFYALLDEAEIIKNSQLDIPLSPNLNASQMLNMRNIHRLLITTNLLSQEQKSQTHQTSQIRFPPKSRAKKAEHDRMFRAAASIADGLRATIDLSSLGLNLFDISEENENASNTNDTNNNTTMTTGNEQNTENVTITSNTENALLAVVVTELIYVIFMSLLLLKRVLPSYDQCKNTENSSNNGKNYNLQMSYRMLIRFLTILISAIGAALITVNLTSDSSDKSSYGTAGILLAAASIFISRTVAASDEFKKHEDETENSSELQLN